MQKVISLHKTISRLVVEIMIAIGLLNVTIGVLQKLFHLNSIYDPHLMGLTPKDFVAFASRRILKHLEFLVEQK